MSTVKSKQYQIGNDASASNNFTIYQPSTPDGTLRIGQGNADSPTEVAQFTSNGYKPNKVTAICGYRSTPQTINNATATKIIYDAIGYETDSSSNYNTSTGTYTAPYNGIYYVVHTPEVGAGPNVMHSGIFVNGGSDASKGMPSVWNQSGNIINSTSDNHSTVNSKILNLTAGDTLEFYTYHNSGASKNTSTTRAGFSITLLHYL